MVSKAMDPFKYLIIENPITFQTRYDIVIIFPVFIIGSQAFRLIRTNPSEMLRNE